MSMSDSFACGVYEKGVLEVCHTHKFTNISKSCVYILVDIIRSFIANIGYNSTQNCNLCRREISNFFDVRRALRKLNFKFDNLNDFVRTLVANKSIYFRISVPKFPKIPKSNIILGSDGTRRERIEKLDASEVQQKEEQEKELAKKSELKKTLLFGTKYNEKKDGDDSNKSNEKRKVVDDDEEIYSFLPPFPPEYTYKFTISENIRERKEDDIQKQKAEERKEIESSLTQIHKVELERYFSHKEFFKKDDWVSDNNDVDNDEDEDEDDEIIVNPYLVISSRKQSTFRETIVEKKSDVVSAKRKVIPESELSKEQNERKRKRRPTIFENDGQQRVKRFKTEHDGEFNTQAHKILTINHDDAGI